MRMPLSLLPAIATGNEALDFIIGEIPFLCVMALMIYFFWIRPKQKEKRQAADEDRKLQVGDEIVFTDGMVGIFVRMKDSTACIESGSMRSKFCYNKDMIYTNLSSEERVKAAYDKLTFWQKAASKI